MVARDDADRAARSRGRHPEAVVLALDDEHLGVHRLELAQPARPWLGSSALGRLQRECEAQNADSTGCRGCTAGDPRARRPSADDERQLVEPVGAESLDHGRPGDVEVGRRRRRTPAGDPVGLLDECDGEPRRDGYIFRPDEILRPDAATRAVPEHDDASAVVGLGDVGVRRTEGSAEHENRHAP